MPRKVSMKQTAILLKLMEENTDMASGKMISADNLKAFWDEAALSLNAPSGGTVKTPNEWRIYWTDIKYRAKKRAAAVHNDLILTGGVASSVRPLTNIEKKVLAIIGEAAAVDVKKENESASPTGTTVPLTVPIKQEEEYSSDEDLDETATNHVTVKIEPTEPIPPQVRTSITPITYRQQGAGADRRWARRFKERRVELEVRRSRGIQLMAKSLQRIESNVNGLVQQMGAAVGCLNRIAQALENMNSARFSED